MLPARPGPATNCAACGKPLTALQRRSGTLCDHWRCRARQQGDAAQAFQARMAEALHEPACRTAHVVHVPGGDTHLGPVPAEQVDALREHLAGLTRNLTGGAAQPPAQRVPAPQPRPRPAEADGPNATSALPSPAQVCGACGGHCCRLAREHHAFLDKNTMRRLLAARPDLAAGELPGLYLAHLPQRHVEDSCAFHGEAGCTLPREMRADLCNHYACEGLIKATAWLQQPSPQHVLVMNPAQGSRRRATLIGPDGARTHTEPSPPPQVDARTTIS